MSIWICCWKLVSGYVCTYMDMLDFYVVGYVGFDEICCWTCSYIVGYIGVICMYVYLL